MKAQDFMENNITTDKKTNKTMIFRWYNRRMHFFKKEGIIKNKSYKIGAS